MMVGEEVDEDLPPEESRRVEEWPPPTNNLELTNKDGTSSRLLFLTVQYVGDEATANFNTGLESFPELEQRVVSPLDPNMGCTACYSPVYRPASPLIPTPVSPNNAYLNPSSPPSQEPGMIVLSEPCQLTSADNYMVTAGGHVFAQDQVSTDDGKLLLLSADTAQPTELVVTEEPCSNNQRVELVLSNGTIAYGIIEATDSNGTRVIQIPRESLPYLVAARTPNNELPAEDTNGQATSVAQDSNAEDENGHMRALYNTLKEQGLIIESGELRLESDLDQNQQLMDTSILEQTTLPILQKHIDPALPNPQKRFWCEECDILLDSDCSEHHVDRKISDKAVPSRARATLPASYLAINRIPDCDKEVYGVFARKNIPQRTQFGPVEGMIIKTEDVMVVHEEPHLELTIEIENGELKTLDVSNEHMSNWMRFVRMASTEKPANLLLSQQGASLYFTTTQMIYARSELLVWYSPAYAQRRNLPSTPPTPVFPCSICGEKLKTWDEMTKHSNYHKTLSKREENLTVNTLRRKNQALVASVKKDFTERNYLGKLPLECTICNKRFPRGYSLKRHVLQLHTRENKYHCKICHLGFSHSYNRLRHMRRVHPNHKDNKPIKNKITRYESWTCSHCDLTFNSASMLNLHTLVHAAKNVEENNITVSDDIQAIFPKPDSISLTCPQCSQKFSSRRKLAGHVSEHGRFKAIRKFHCDICGRNFISAVRFQVHNEMHSNEEKKPLQCHICLKRLLTKSALSCHLKIHDCTVQWECPMCKDQFSNVLSLRTHVYSHAVNGMFHCTHCDKAFEEYSGIRKHIRAFHSDRIHSCLDCEKTFPTLDKLRMHCLKHSDHREFLCADCGKQFKRKDKLKEHMKRLHSSENVTIPDRPPQDKKMLSKIVTVNPSDYERYIYKCHTCMLGFKRRGMLVNHLANRHPDITPDSVPELNLPILKTTRDYYCQYCDKIYKSSSKRKAHILKNHPGLELPMSNRQKGGVPEIPGLPNPTFSQTVGSITTNPHGCQWCHKQYASKAKLLQHCRKKHINLMPQIEQTPRPLKNPIQEENVEKSAKNDSKEKTVNFIEIADEEPVPIALSTNKYNQITLSAASLNQLQAYEIIATEDDAGANDILIDTSSVAKRPSCKNDNISTDLLSQAMSEIGVSLSDLRALSFEQYLKMLQSPNGGLVMQDSLYMPYTAR